MLQSKYNNYLQDDIQKNITLCQRYVRTLFSVTFQRDDILNWFYDLCRNLTRIIELIGKYYKEKSSNFNHNTLLLYLTQIITALSLLINIFVCEEEKNLVLVQARKCITKQLTCCLESVEVSLTNEGSLDDPSGNFVKWMDVALEKLMEIDIQQGKAKSLEIYEETHELFEEVLSHAMSMAQVSLPEDSKSIRGSCQVVLNTLNSLHKELNNSKINEAMVNLFIDACNEKLCLLEKKVNVAVLRLCLYTFTEFFEPLERINNFCSNQCNKSKIDELDGLVADFDLHIDRIMQIGLFAVSCSSDSAWTIKIRSCLASLEALESELVPSLTSSLLDNSKHNTNCAKILMDHWINQANCLQQFIYIIIDPFAFCQVIYEKASDMVENYTELLENNCLLNQNEINGFIRTVKVLPKFLHKARTEFSDTEVINVEKALEDFNKDEVESASKVLLSREQITHENCKRVLKRCRILQTVLKRIWLCFVDDLLPNKNVSLEKKMTDLKVRIETAPTEPTGNAFLDHIIFRGNKILQDRSVLYRTPIKSVITTSNAMQMTNSKRRQNQLSNPIHVRKLCFLNSANPNATNLDLQITDILKEVANLSVTLNPKKSRNQSDNN